MSKINVLIPARGGSKRIPRKNIKLLGGKPLIQWTIESSLSLPVDHVVVSTEDEAIADISRSLGATVLMRPAELATDFATDNDVVDHFIDHYLSDFVIYLRPTTPFRCSCFINDAIGYAERLNHERIRPTSMRSVHKSPESAFKTFTRQSNGVIDPITYHGIVYSDVPNQQCPSTYIPNGYVDIIIYDQAYENRTDVFGDTIFGYITDPVIELDTEEQWNYAEYLVEKGLV